MDGLFQRLRRDSFVVLGRAGMDLYADPPGTPADRAARFVTALGGAAGNVAAQLSRLGSSAALLTRVSDDAVGRFVLNECARYGIGTAWISVAGGGRRTSLAVTETRLQGTQTVIYRNGAADLSLTGEDVARVDFSGLGALVVTGTALAAEPSRDAARRAADMARRAGAAVVFDIDHRAYSWASEDEAGAVCRDMAERSDIVVGNEEEFALLGGNSARGADCARELSRMRGGIAVYKMGARGSVAWSPEGMVETPVFPAAARKPMGSGDAFLGGMLSALGRGDGLDEALRQGSAAAAIVVSGIGCAPASPDRAQLDAFMRSHRNAHTAV